VCLRPRRASAVHQVASVRRASQVATVFAAHLVYLDVQDRAGSSATAPGNRRMNSTDRVARAIRDKKYAPMAGFKGGRANWAVAQGPPQLRGLHKNSKNIT